MGTSIHVIDRRVFLRGSMLAGGALVLGLRLDGDASADIAAPASLNPFVCIAPDGTVTILTPDAEMGQGIYTALPMIVAEELEVDFARVQVALSGADAAFNNPRKGYQATGQSMAVRGFFASLRKVGAAAREMLVAAAAARWSVAAGECTASLGEVVHGPTGRRLGYGDLAAEAAKLAPPQEPRLKDPSQFRLLGRPAHRKDTPPKVDGSAVFGADVVRPGMLHAAIRQSPVAGGRVTSVDESSIAGMRGVEKVVRLDDAVAVVADSWWRAERALGRLHVEFDLSAGKGITHETVYADLRRALDQPGAVHRREGDVEAALSAATRRLEATYEVPYLAHATMEPMSCVAEVTADACTLWAPTQGPGVVRDLAAKITGLPPGKVTVHRTFVGGGFGRRWQTDWAGQAVRIAQAVGRPVKLQWTRAEDTTHDFYRPAMASRYRAGLDAEGRLVAADIRVAGGSILEQMRPGSLKGKLDPTALTGVFDELPLPALRIDYVNVRSPLPIGMWRSVAHSQNGFFKETFVDELAVLAGRDPYEYRRELYRGLRQARVLEVAAEKAGWGSRLPRGRGRGIAVVEGYESVVAQVAEVSVTKGELKVHRIVSVMDCGFAIDPRNVEAQVEGAIIYGLSAALWGEVPVAEGAVSVQNFDAYRVLRLHEVPTIESHLLPSEYPPGGVGEPPLPPVAPAVANAIFAATGIRIRRLPIARTPLNASRGGRARQGG